MEEATLSAAVAAHQSGDLVKAETLYRAVIAADPAQADACALLGTVLGAKGAFDEALQWADRAVALDGKAGILHFHRGTTLLAAKKWDDAVIALRRAAELLPQLAQAHYNLANALRAAGDWPGAIAAYRMALARDAEYLDAYNNLALSLVHEKFYEEAAALAKKAVALDANFGDGWLTLCNVAEKLRDYEGARAAGERAVALMPRNHFAWFGYGLALNRAGRDTDAIEAYKRALDLNPTRSDILDNLAQSYQALGRLEEAEATFRKAVEVAGQVIAGEGAREVSEDEYGNRHWHLALVELLRGKYREGFARYRARFKEIAALKRMDFPCPLWKGEDLRGKTLLVCDEQGYGDTLMLARFMPLLRARGARTVFLVHKVLAPLFAGWAGADAVVPHGGQIPPCDYFCSSFDLPHRLGITLGNLPHDVPYLPLLPPDGATRLPQEGPRVGVVWGGSPLHLNDNKRSVPLEIFAGLFSVPGIKFYSFNRDLKPGDADILPRYPIENLVPRLTDFATAARLVGQMDLLITCDTATAHLAGGLGKPVWVMLPFAPDWRWLTERADSPWYPTARLFRQPAPGDWAGAVSAVKAELVRLFSRF